MCEISLAAGSLLEGYLGRSHVGFLLPLFFLTPMCVLCVLCVFICHSRPLGFLSEQNTHLSPSFRWGGVTKEQAAVSRRHQLQRERKQNQGLKPFRKWVQERPFQEDDSEHVPEISGDPGTFQAEGTAGAGCRWDPPSQAQEIRRIGAE